MPDLPTKSYAWYIGVDPGFTGGFAAISANGQEVKTWAMPIIDTAEDRRREFDLSALHLLCTELLSLGPTRVVGLEWPTTRPGEGAERSERFGRGKGYLDAFFYLLAFDYYKLSPQLWKGRLGLPGKTQPGANQIVLSAFDAFYPTHGALVRGSRGGVLSGRLDAAMIAHFLRVHTVPGMRAVARQFGKDSPETLAMILSRGKPGGRRRRNWDTNFT